MRKCYDFNEHEMEGGGVLKKYFKGFSLYLLIFVLLILAIMLSANNNPLRKPNENYIYTDLLVKLDENQVKKIEIYPNLETPTGRARATLNNGEILEVVITNTFGFETLVREQYPTVPIDNKDLQRPSWLIQLLPSFIIMIIVIFVMMFFMQQAQGGGGGNRVMSFGKSRAKMTVDDKKKVTFNNVAGLDEEKEELKEIVEFLKQPRKFVEVGARIPKGVLLVGPPGTGKTLLAKAVAGEAGVPFFSISGSDFVEMFVGVGASRVRDLFEQAKKNSPCIIFIDEIDAVGRRRGAGLGGGHDEREQTLNQLLVEMDGFGANEGVIVVAATNRMDILDPALLRPGRFDRRVVVGRPDVKGREEILQVHAKGKPLGEDVNLRVIAQTTAGFTGADLENLLNESSIFAARDNKKVISMEDIQRAFIKVGIGTEKKSRVISDREKRITAYHEAGHALLHHILSELDPVHSISIIPTGMAGGYTMPLPGEDRLYMTKKQMEQEIIALLGGRAAEKLVFDDVTTGASNDIERATAIARNMVTRYGMSDVLGPIQFGDDAEEVFVGRDLGHTRNYGENVASLIDTEIRRIVEGGYQEAMALLEKNRTILDQTAELLIEKEKLSGADFEALFPPEDSAI
ncbi:MAG: ATP-dependent zinc metalloprotease FtsH [Epulopiscium sp.]|nr:ATP-dependent zinc metalloprotease FtsH [Candidatus Epulonipiscium sp.]